MILQESLWPGMTRQGFAHKTQVVVTPGDRNLFPVTDEGRWLPKVETSRVSYEAALRLVNSELLNGYSDSLVTTALKSIEVDSETGCWTGDELSDTQHTDALWGIAEFDMRGRVLNARATKKILQICDQDDCLNARHFDFTHQVKNRDKLLEPNPEHFLHVDNGQIMPTWEIDELEPFLLPSLQESISDLRELQLRCVPFIDDARLAPLTPNAISKITINDLTGCWMTRTYYNRPDDFEKGFMFDGYGRLGFGPALKTEGAAPEGRFMAHRVLWTAMGGQLEDKMILNHECGFHPCCYPKHLTQMSTGQNNTHARRMNGSIKPIIET